MEHQKDSYPNDQPTPPPPPPPPKPPVPPPTPEPGQSPDPEDVAKNRTVASLAYFVFFLPLLVCPTSPFARYHANQGLILLIVAVAGSLLGAFLPFIQWAIAPVVFAFAVLGFVNANNGKLQPLPIIGSLRLIR